MSKNKDKGWNRITKKGQNNSSLNNPVINSQDIYEGGGLSEIKIDDLLHNKVAIRQLVNDYNNKAKRLEETLAKETELQTDLEFQKTSPAYAVFATIINIIGSILIGIGSGLLTGDRSNLANTILVIGGILILTGNIMTILHRWIRQWCNNKA